jgi:hypothetical protein
VKELESNKLSPSVMATWQETQAVAVPISHSLDGQMIVTLSGRKLNLEKMDNLSLQDLNVLKKYSSLNGPKVVSEDLASGFRLSEATSGESLAEYLKRTGGKMSPKVESQLKKVIDEASLLAKETKIRLDLSSDNIRIWNETVQLVKARHADVGVKLPKDYVTYLASLKSAPKSNFKCGKLMSALLQLKTY